MAEVDEHTRRTALEGFVRAQWLSAELGGGHVEQAGTVRRVMFRDPGVRPDWVYPGRHDQAAWEAASRYVDESKRRGRPCLLIVDDAGDPSLEQRYVRMHDLDLVTTDRCMVLPDLSTGHGSAADDVDVDVDVVRDEEGWRALVDTSAAIFGAPAELFEVLYPREMLHSDAIQAALARVDGAVIGVAAAYIADDAVGVYGVATAGTYRRRGIGQVLTRWAVDTGAHHGAAFAYLQPSAMGRPLYSRMGFCDVGGYRRYLYRPA